MALNIKKKRSPRAYYNEIPKMQQWFEEVVPQLPNERYKYFFRMTREQYEVVKTNILSSEDKNLCKGELSLDKRIHLTLYYLGHNAEIVEMSDRFNMSVGSVFKYINQMTTIIADLFQKTVRWATNEEKEVIKNGFRSMGGLDNCIGAIDGSHINIAGVGEYRTAYTTRKLCYAMNITVVSDHRKCIRFAIVGAPGSYNDTRVFNYAPFATEDGDFFNGLDVLFGDSAYTLTNRMIVPYGNPNAQEMQFNYLHSKMRVIVENCFGLLKGKWKIMGTTIRYKKDITKASQISKACIVLHNLCLTETVPGLDVAANIIEAQGTGDDRGNRFASSTRGGIERREDMRINFQ